MSNLEESYISTLDDGLRRAVPELYRRTDPKLSTLKKIFEDLSIRELISVHGNYKGISLTEDGFNEASKTCWRRFVEFLNNNPGLAILISVVSLIVAVVALFKSTN